MDQVEVVDDAENESRSWAFATPTPRVVEFGFTTTGGSNCSNAAVSSASLAGFDTMTVSGTGTSARPRRASTSALFRERRMASRSLTHGTPASRRPLPSCRSRRARRAGFPPVHRAGRASTRQHRTGPYRGAPAGRASGRSLGVRGDGQPVHGFSLSWRDKVRSQPHSRSPVARLVPTATIHRIAGRVDEYATIFKIVRQILSMLGSIGHACTTISSFRQMGVTAQTRRSHTRSNWQRRTTRRFTCSLSSIRRISEAPRQKQRPSNR